jgi:hypothetical protein
MATMTSNRLRIFRIGILPVLLLFTFGASLQLNEWKKTLEERVIVLERRVDSLESTLANLTKNQIESKSAQLSEQGTLWKNLSNWRARLRKGLTRDEVRKFMGESDKIDVYSLIGNVWHYGYPGGGRIKFSEQGLVDSWSEPSNLK